LTVVLQRMGSLMSISWNKNEPAIIMDDESSKSTLILSVAQNCYTNPNVTCAPSLLFRTPSNIILKRVAKAEANRMIEQKFSEFFKNNPN